MELPAAVGRLADELIGSDGAVAVVVGGSRATGGADPASDWDLGLYHRGPLDLTALAAWGEVHGPGSWGRIMNGGAWLDVDGRRVDVLLRDLDVVAHWTAEATAGRYEVDAVLGYVAGLPTYSLMAEAALAVPVRGSLATVGPFPAALAHVGAGRWRIHRDFSLMYATMHARRANVVGVHGQLARAIFEEAHARACERHRWVLNEKHLLTGAGLDGTAALLARPATSVAELNHLVAAVHTAFTKEPG